MKRKNSTTPSGFLQTNDISTLDNLSSSERPVSLKNNTINMNTMLVDK